MGITYTRYADDLSFSSQSIEKIYKAKFLILHIIKDEGFILNTKKTKMMGYRKRKEITGLVITAYYTKTYRPLNIVFEHETYVT